MTVVFVIVTVWAIAMTGVVVLLVLAYREPYSEISDSMKHMFNLLYRVTDKMNLEDKKKKR